MNSQFGGVVGDGPLELTLDLRENLANEREARGQSFDRRNARRHDHDILGEHVLEESGVAGQFGRDHPLGKSL
jgi:hypothetical protein